MILLLCNHEMLMAMDVVGMLFFCSNEMCKYIAVTLCIKNNIVFATPTW